MLKNVIEIDETYLGGSNSNRHKDKKVPRCQGRNWKDKIPVLGAVERESGNMIALVVPNVKRNTLEPIIRANIKKGSIIHTDEWLAYNRLYKWFKHQRVNHRIKQYVNGDVSTNAIENRWSHLNRLIYGIYIHISRKHAQKYVDEFVLRNNTRKYSIRERFDLILSSAMNKNITYRELIK